MKSKVLFVAVLSYGLSAMAQVQTQQPVSAPFSPPPSVISVMTPAASLSVTGAPVKIPDSKEVKQELKYFDGSKRLTIGEMSEMQRQKISNDFLAKLGFTTVEPIKPPPPVKLKAPPPPPNVLIVKAIYGKINNEKTDLLFNEKLVTLGIGEQITINNTIIRTNKVKNGNGFAIHIPGTPPPKGCKTKNSKSSKKCTLSKDIDVILESGGSIEFARR